MDDVSAIATEAVRVLLDAKAPIWIVLAAVLLVAFARVMLPKIRLPKVTVEPSPTVDEGGEQQPGTSLQQGADGGFILPTDPNREDLDSGGG